MRKFKRLLTKFINATPEGLLRIFQDELPKFGYKKIFYCDDYLTAEGELPVAICCHVDTVFPSTGKKNLLYDQEEQIFFCPTGAGFDDRAGLIMLFFLLKKGLKPHIILTNREELGGLGAQELAKTYCPFGDLRYIIQLDRHGMDDCVFYDCDNPQFQDYVESFGFKKDYGSFTDITFLCPAWGVAGVNLSIGYYNEHTHSEILCFNSFKQTLKKVIGMLEASEEAEEFKFIARTPSKILSKKACLCCDQLVEYWIQLPSNQIFCEDCYNMLKEYNLLEDASNVY